MPYNITHVANSTGLLQFVQRVNSEIMNEWLGNSFLFMIFCIILISILAKTDNARKAFATASFVCFTFSLLLRALEMVGGKAVYITLILAAFSVAMLKAE